ncbi:MAG: glycosyltransferase [Candidatus Aenigmarchaeota archaeon]|nr:glycosyltransferase [Candidatus Aenigmarchaeota archaeon]
MRLRSKPLVSVVTPVYNGEKYLVECIESVLSQTYENWEYIIVNNCSTDRTLEIASEFANRDARIKIHNNETFFKIIPNWNHAMRQISPDSKYCKLIHADDLLFPECIEKMVKVAEEKQSAAMVGAYRLNGDHVDCVGFPYPDTSAPGRDICRLTLKRKISIFGSPTTLLLRSEIIRERNPFYDESVLHADKEVCFDILRNYDFGFVHQILTYTRLHDESQSSTFAERLDTSILENFGLLLKYGRHYYDDDEFVEIYRESEKRYYRFLSRKLMALRKKEFWKYHINGLNNMGYKISFRKLFVGTVSELVHMLLNLQITVERIQKFIEKKKRKSF